MRDLIGPIVTDAALRYPGRTALKVPRGPNLTYRELDRRSTQLANALLEMGCSRGDRVAAWLETCPEYLELYFAVAKAGLVLVPINSMFTEHEARHQVDDSGATVLFHAAGRESVAQRLTEGTALSRLVAVGTWGDAGSGYELLLASGGSELPPVPEEDDLYLIAYTSGTTGRPKGAMVTQRTLMGTLRQHAHSYRTPQFSVCIYHSNMSFVATVLGLIMGHLYVNGTVVMTGKVSAEDLLDVIEAERGTFTFVPSPWIVPLTELAARAPHKWESIRTFVHSASKCNPADLKAWADVVGHRFLEGWGMTEASGALVTVTDVDDVVRGSAADDLYASVGRPVLETVVRVVDADGVELPRDGRSIGELVVRGPSIVVGYWNNAAASQQTFRDGWYFSGDLGCIDQAGYVYVTERRSDLVITGGMNVYPSEIEHCIAGLPGVQEVAVIGEPHPRWGQTPVAVVVRVEGQHLDERDVLEHCQTYLARYKRPSSVRFVDALPRSASNKILKRVLRSEAPQQSKETL